MSCLPCSPRTSGPVPRTNTRNPVPEGQRQEWVVVHRSGGQTVETPFSGGNSVYLAACREAAKVRGRVWPRGEWDKQKQEGGTAS